MSRFSQTVFHVLDSMATSKSSTSQYASWFIVSELAVYYMILIGMNETRASNSFLLPKGSLVLVGRREEKSFSSFFWSFRWLQEMSLIYLPDRDKNPEIEFASICIDTSTYACCQEGEQKILLIEDIFKSIKQKRTKHMSKQLCCQANTI